MIRQIAVISSLLVFAALAAKPPVAPTPPMGWNSWEAFRKDLHEDANRAQAVAMVQLGLRDAGYKYVVLDGGWKTSARDSAGNLVPDPQKSPTA
jgi:alpha-galactosidase